MRMLDIIAKKRDGEELTAGEINDVINGYTENTIPDYQMASLLMAIYLRGMNSRETAALTIAMANSGEKVNLSVVNGIKIDKHSTGGVADTTTLILAPLVAAAGVPVAKMSGRGLGFTGGTIDKLESIPGFRTELSDADFIDIIKKHGLALTSQSAKIAPADGKIYALRDVTATVESIPLIASSIMSKKIAAGADKILLDVKVGSGAFIKKFDNAIDLATTMVEIGEQVGRETSAILTSMDEPLGTAVGNSLEVREAIEVLSGCGPEELKHVCLMLGSFMVKMAGVVTDETDGYALLKRLLDEGKALEKFKEFIAAQGGNPHIVDEPGLLPQAKRKVRVESVKKGVVHSIDTAQIGRAAMLLGAGRERKNQMIDLAAGLTLQCRIGDYIEENQSLAILHCNNTKNAETAAELVRNALHIHSNGGVVKPKLILGIVDKFGYRKF